MRPPRSPAPAHRLVIVLVVSLLAGCAGCAEGRGIDDSEAGAAPVPVVSASAVASLFPPSDVLRRWDRARARAFAQGDVAALRALYVEGSAAGTADVRMLRDYLRRGLRVEGMRMQLFAVEVIHADHRRLVLEVTDRLTGAVAVGRGSRTPLPRDAASTRTVELRRSRPGVPWRVAAVRESVQRPAAR